MSAGTEFTIGLGRECASRFVVYDSGTLPPRSPRLRAALEQHRDELRARLCALEQILESDSPERAECCMIDGTFARVERLVLRPDAKRSARAVALAIDTLEDGLTRSKPTPHAGNA